MDVITKVADSVGRLEHGRIVEQSRVVDLVLDPDSPLGQSLRPRGASAPEAPGQTVLTATYHSAAVPADWISQVGTRIGAPIAILGATVQTVDGVSAGDFTIAVPEGDAGAVIAAAAELGITARLRVTQRVEVAA